MRITDIYTLHNGIVTCDELSNPNGNFITKLALAFETVDSIVQAVEKSRPKKSKILQEYDKKAKALIFKYAAQDENGNLKMEGNTPFITKPIEYQKESNELEEFYKSEIEEYNNILEKWSSIFDQDVIEFTKNELLLPSVKRNEFPKEITVKQMRGIVLLLEHEIEK